MNQQKQKPINWHKMHKDSINSYVSAFLISRQNAEYISLIEFIETCIC
jgi:hypothetical protein